MTLKRALTPRVEFTTEVIMGSLLHYAILFLVVAIIAAFFGFGGVAGVVAPLVGKQPPDSHVWVLEGEAPAFVKSEGPLAMGGDSWRIELVSPVWPKR